MKHILNRYFDKIYCVTVFDFHDRHTLVKQQLNGIDFEWIFSPPNTFLNDSKFITSSELSLNIGHMNCVWNAKLNGYKKIAIWEDDGTLTVSEDIIERFLNNIPDNWDCLYMGNASWNEGIFNVKNEFLSEFVNKVFWATGSGFNAIQNHVYDDLITNIMSLEDPVDFNYYKIFERGNTYGPSNGYFSDPISMPSEHCLDKVSDTSKFLKSRIQHKI